MFSLRKPHTTVSFATRAASTRVLHEGGKKDEVRADGGRFLKSRNDLEGSSWKRQGATGKRPLRGGRKCAGLPFAGFMRVHTRSPRVGVEEGSLCIALDWAPGKNERRKTPLWALIALCIINDC